ncbi:hypothetical protein EC973_007120 [Apophysomyces ossiformis]|uniref:U6 small nuclear RNA (adenine-(43)-N(6))-methyltransferase n=1 Tax=Apophysomyces ossiformis TaxID=679940 RepID=A0A8H7ET11_9FUNG|nr:hypothetical protein EC973_007120 [Apophysomyces ossiformis]
MNNSETEDLKRLNYILWLQDLMDETLPEQEEIAGIDIGVGASCIYPLLGCASRRNWTFLGTDIDKRSIRYARENVKRNGLDSRITIKHNDNPERIFLLDEDRTYHFCMCNPPFYSSQEEIEEGLRNKELEPSAVCTGSDNEMVTAGGEYGFIKRMINESVTYKTRIKWYTSMIGQKKTIKPLVDLLKSNNITNYLVTDFCQGRTKRWGIAWSFDSKRVISAKSLDVYRPKCQFSVCLPKSMEDIHRILGFILDDLDIDYTQPNDCTIQGEPQLNTWSRAARRRKKLKLENTTPPEEAEPLFAFCFELEEKTGCEVKLSWLSGNDRGVFESFWNHIKKRIQEECGIVRGSAFNK